MNGPATGQTGNFEAGRTGGLLAFVLAENHDDVMSLGMFSHYVSAHPIARYRALRPTTLGYLRNGLAAGLLRVGDVVGTQHHPWDLSYTAALARIEAAWPPDTDSTFAGLRDVCWLANTAKGNRAAELHKHRTEKDCRGLR